MFNYRFGRITIDKTVAYSAKKNGILNLRKWATNLKQNNYGLMKHCHDITMEEINGWFLSWGEKLSDKTKDNIVKFFNKTDEYLGLFGVIIVQLPVILFLSLVYPFVYMYKIPHAWASIQVAKKIMRRG
jgi:hypothetical protein